MKFRREDGEFDVEMFEHAVDVVLLAQEILVGYSSYPTPEIGRNAKRFRQLGLGYANLGALLMARGLPYDSDEGRAYAAAITALMTGRAYRKSAEVAKRMGPHAGYQENRAAMVGVIAKHRAAVGNIDHTESAPDDLLTGARHSWDEALEIGEVHGFRNAQATVLAPTGTISFMMDCDTTGVEPDFRSSSRRSPSAGARSRSSTRRCRWRSRSRLRAARGRGDRRVHRRARRRRRRAAPEDRALPRVRLRDRRARDPVHGAREDDGRGAAVHLGRDLEDGEPAQTTIDEIAKPSSSRGSWGSRRSRSTATTARSPSRSRARARQGGGAAPGRATGVVPHPQRRRLRRPTEVGRKFKVGDYEGYIHVGLFEDGTPGDIFVDIAKEGTTSPVS